MSDQPTYRLSDDEIAALTFAARRQLTRWGNRRELSPREREQRTALVAAIRIIETFADGCELRAIGDDSNPGGLARPSGLAALIARTGFRAKSAGAITLLPITLSAG